MTKKRPTTEKEFGVPIPGEILEPDRWAKTALKTARRRTARPSRCLPQAPLIVDLLRQRSFRWLRRRHGPNAITIGIDTLPVVPTRRAGAINAA